MFISLFMLFCFLLFFYVYDPKEKDNYQVIYIDHNKSTEIYLGCIDENGKVIKLNLNSSNDEIDLSELFSYYTIKQNSLPNNFYSPLGFDANIKSMEVINNKLYIKIDKINNADLVDEFIECIRITLEENKFDNEIDEVLLVVGLSNYNIKYNKTQ